MQPKEGSRVSTLIGAAIPKEPLGFAPWRRVPSLARRRGQAVLASKLQQAAGGGAGGRRGEQAARGEGLDSATAGC